VVGQLTRVGVRACERGLDRALHRSPRLLPHTRPLRGGHQPRDQELAQPDERIARALIAQRLGRLVRLRVLAAMPAQARHAQAQQQRRALLAHTRHGLARELGCRARIAPIAFEQRKSAEGAQVGDDVASRGLQP
jgi:hypothetical protein